MARHEVNTTGVMFNTGGYGPGSDQEWPTLADVDRANYVNPHGLDLPDAIRETWLAVAWNPRVLAYSEPDAEAMDETNYAVIIDTAESWAMARLPHVGSEMGGEGFNRFTWHTVGVDDALEAGIALFGSLSSGDVLAVAPDFAGLDDFADLRRQLENYPFLDEDAYYKLENEAWFEYAPQALRDELATVTDGRYDDETLELLETVADELLPILEQHLHYNNGFSGDYRPDFLDIYDELIADEGPTLNPEGGWFDSAISRSRAEVRAIADPRTGHALAALLRGTYNGPDNYVPGQQRFAVTP